MNCKKGDLAMIVRSYAGNHGKVVTCLELVGVADEKGLPVKYGGEIITLAKGTWWKIDQDLELVFENQVFHKAPFSRDEFMIPIGNRDVPMEVKSEEKEPA